MKSVIDVDTVQLQQDLSALQKWENDWQMTPQKCTTIHISKNQSAIRTKHHTNCTVIPWKMCQVVNTLESQSAVICHGASTSTQLLQRRLERLDFEEGTSEVDRRLSGARHTKPQYTHFWIKGQQFWILTNNF